MTKPASSKNLKLILKKGENYKIEFKEDVYKNLIEKLLLLLMLLVVIFILASKIMAT